MRTDPRAACANARERLLWALLHDGIAHPLMAITNYSSAAVRFHDFTSRRAWPRPGADAHTWRMVIVSSRFGMLAVENPRPRYWIVRHGRARHALGTIATHQAEAIAIAESHFQQLADAFGGTFSATPDISDAECSRGCGDGPCKGTGDSDGGECD
ncbi:hypothetical protein GIY62_14590 [Burkholderia plantarii]|uniref:hypothetical protein n=1 Tax=Burkholderia plantarii TaxID=41899 RepID=UPI00272BE965|nr:hypothetical protein [Burkholderia plantarii]WLE58354.1 hypothetical protein GIY62_14590 [Burkholderia plantarii]